MAITINTDLRHLNPVRNPVLLTATTDSHLSYAGRDATFEAEFDNTAMPAVGDTMQVQAYDGTAWEDDYTITFVTAGTADGSKNQVNAYTAGSVDDWITDELIPVLLLDYALATHYTFTAGADTVVGTGTSYSAPRRRLLTSDFSFVSTAEQSAIAPIEQENMGMLVQLWMEATYKANDYVLRLEEKYPVKSDGSLRPNLAQVLRDYLEPTQPAADMTTAVKMVDMARRFYVRLYEEYGDPVVQYSQTTSSIRTALLAGRPEHIRVGTPEWRTYLQPTTTGGKFLTCWPNTTWDTAKVIRAQQREFLAYIEPNIGGISTYRLMADIYYTDGTDDLDTQLESVNQEQAGQPLLFAVGIEARNLNATKTVDRMRIWLRAVGTGLDTRITEYRYFRVDHRQHSNWRQLHFFNTWGGWDTIALTGARSSSAQADRLISARDTTDPPTLDEARDVVVSNRTIDTTHQVGTIYLHRDELQALRDLLASERIVERVGTEHWPVQLLTDRAAIGSETTDLDSFDLSYRYAFRNTANAR